MLDLRNRRKLLAAKGFGVDSGKEYGRFIWNERYYLYDILLKLPNVPEILNTKTGVPDFDGNFDGFVIYADQSKTTFLGAVLDYAYQKKDQICIERIFVYYQYELQIFDPDDGSMFAPKGFQVIFIKKPGYSPLSYTLDETEFDEIIDRYKNQINKLEELKLKVAKQIKLWSI